MNMPLTFVGCGFSLEEAGQTLSDITSSLFATLLVSSKVSKHANLSLSPVYFSI